jgi:hypothetical protein
MDTFAGVAPAGIAELAMDPPAPLPYQSAHDIVGDLSDETIDALVQASGAQSGLAALQLRHLGGALQRRPEGAGARADLPGHIMAFAVGMVMDEMSVPVLRRTLNVVRTMLATDHTGGRYASFVEEPADASAFYDPATWARLRAIKALYDPEDVIRGNHHVPPAN